MKSLLFVIEHLQGGGAERQISQIVAHFAARGDQVALATWASSQVRDKFVLPRQVQRSYLRRREQRRGRIDHLLNTALAWLKLVRLIRRTKPDAIVSFSEASNILTLAAGRRAGRPVAVSIRTNPIWIFEIHPHWRRPSLRAYRLADAVVVQTEAAAEWCRRECGRSAIVIPNFVRDLPSPPEPLERDKLVVAVGNLFRHKGHDLLLNAFSRISGKYPDWRLTIVGEGPERASLEALARDVGIEDAVSFPGFVDDVDGLLGRASISVLSSRAEGYPNALIEAMAMGVAVISTDCEFGPREIIHPEEDGLLVHAEDPVALAQALERLISDVPLRARLAKRAGEIRQRLSAGAIMPKWDALVDRLAGGGAEARSPDLR